MTDLIGYVLVVLGVLFNLFGCVGLVRLPDVYNRLQAATKCVTLGTCSVFAGAVFLHGFDALGLKALLAIPLLFLVSPTGAHALARGAHRFGVKLWPKSELDAYADDEQGVSPKA